MEKNISIDELNSICKKMNELNDQMGSHDRNGRNLYEEIAWHCRNDNYITDIVEENLSISRYNEMQRERFIEEMREKQASEIRKQEENMRRNNEREKS